MEYLARSRYDFVLNQSRAPYFIGEFYFFAPLYIGSLLFTLFYFDITFLPLFTSPVDDLPHDKMSLDLKTKTPPYGRT